MSVPLDKSQDIFGERGIWRCTHCGDPPDASPQWYWAGDHWQHYHRYPVGHEPAIYFPLQPNHKVESTEE